MSGKRTIYVITCISWLLILLNLPVGFKSYADEAFFVLGLNPEQNLGIQHSQFFQIARFMFRTLSIDPVILHSRIMTYVLMTATLFFFSLASYRWLKKKEQITGFWGVYISLVFLYGMFIFFSGYEMSLSFNHLHICFVSVMFSMYLLWDLSEQSIVQSVWIFAIGCFSFLAVMNYFPSGLLVSFILFFLILFKEKHSWTGVVLSALIFLAGIGCCAVMYDFLIYPVKSAVNELITSIKNPAFGTGGYDLHSYLEQILEYAGSITTLFLSCCGIYFLYRINRLQKQWNKKGILWIIICLFGLFIVVENKLLRYNLAIVPILFTCIVYYMSKPFSPTQVQPKPPLIHLLQKPIFFLFPILAVQGTNVGINYKILYFAFIWILILTIYLYRIRNTKIKQLLLYLTVGFAFCLSGWSHLHTFSQVRGTFLNSKYTVENNRQFNHIRLNQSQIDYFQQIDSLLQAHHFDSKQDRIFALDFDYPALLYLNATNYGGLMHHILNMPAYKTVFFSAANEPDYILVFRKNRNLFMKTVVENFEWNFPSDYNEYKIEGPDPAMAKLQFSGPRSLFIRKNRTP